MPEQILTRKFHTRSIEFHYSLGHDRAHSMDAFVQNKCEHEILAAIKGLADYFQVRIVVETEPLGDGSLKRIWKVISTQEHKKAVIGTSLITAFLTILFTVPFTKLTEKTIEKLFEDPEIKMLEKQKLRLEVKKLQKELVETPQDPEKQVLLSKRVSNFYDRLQKAGRVDAVSVVANDSTGSLVLFKKTVPREEFFQFISTDDELPSIVVEHALIEIVAPVLKSGKFKWLGIYEDSTIHFSMKSSEFKELVRAGNVEFKNGSTIDCVLEIKRKIGSDGEVKSSGYEVLVVNSYFDNDRPTETIEGRKRRSQNMSTTKQLNLFDEEENED